jgi:hypothetical protein
MTHIDWLNTLTSFGVGIAILILALGYINSVLGLYNTFYKWVINDRITQKGEI